MLIRKGGMALQKQSYYVTVGTGEVMNEPTLSEWEFEILALPEEIIQLKTLFEEIDQEAWTGFWRAHVPIVSYHHDATNDRYDDHLQHIYQWIYDHGTDETRQHIASMHILSDEKENG